MFFRNYDISYCCLNLLIFSSLIILFSSFGINSKSEYKVMGNLNVEEFSFITLFIGIILFFYSIKNVCRRKNCYDELV